MASHDEDTGKRPGGLIGVIGRRGGKSAARRDAATQPGTTAPSVASERIPSLATEMSLETDTRPAPSAVSDASSRPAVAAPTTDGPSVRPDAGLPALNATPPEPRQPRLFSQSMVRYTAVGVLTCVILVFGIGGWAAVARISSAVVAGGKIVVSSNTKAVQHPDGGIVGEIRVRNGDTVAAGELLIRLDETLTKANREVIDSQLVALEARLARLKAERDGLDRVPDPTDVSFGLSPDAVKRAVESERQVFAARRETLDGQTERLTERIGQLRQQIDGYRAQRDAKQLEIDLIEDELVDLETLFEKGHVPKTRIMALKREKARLQGEHGEFMSRIAISEGRINETELEILSMKQDFQERVYSEITEIEPEIANLRERRIAAEFQLRHTDIVAPYDGVVDNLIVHTVGGVIQPGETIMEIVPQEDHLLIEAQIAPTDIEEVFVGQEASIVLSAFNMRTAPRVKGTVTFKAADRIDDRELGISYFVARITLDEGELEKLGEDITIVPGMPAEVFIATGARTVIDYLIRPLTDQFRRTMTES